MTKSSVKAMFDDSIQDVWNVVTNVRNYSVWRSDVSKGVTIDTKHVIEYAENSYATNFAVTAMEEKQRWEFDMDNSNMSGHWTGIFKENGGKTEVEFIEEVTAKKFIMKPFVKGYLKKQQVKFVEDLRNALKKMS